MAKIRIKKVTPPEGFIGEVSIESPEIAVRERMEKNNIVREAELQSIHDKHKKAAEREFEELNRARENKVSGEGINSEE